MRDGIAIEVVRLKRESKNRIAKDYVEAVSSAHIYFGCCRTGLGPRMRLH